MAGHSGEQCEELIRYAAAQLSTGPRGIVLPDGRSGEKERFARYQETLRTTGYYDRIVHR